MSRRIAWTVVLALLAGIGASPAPAEAETDGVWDYEPASVSGSYEPFVGDFAGDLASDVFWYAPGTGVDTLWIGAEGERTVTKEQFAVDETTLVPVVGDFGGDTHDDIIWYQPGPGVDRLWIATGDETVFDTSRTVTLNGTYRPRVLHDYREGNKDRVFWYRPGDGTDPLWIFDADATYTTVTNQIRSTLQVIAGDWNGDGMEDLLLYGPGSLPDRLWRSRRGPFTSTNLSINGRYQATTVYAVPYDEVLFFGTGDNPDVYWHNSAGGFDSQSIYVPARGKAATAGIGAAIIYNPVGDDDVVIDSGDSAAAYALSDTRDIGSGKVVLIGDFDGDNYTDLIIYGPGAAGDQILVRTQRRGPPHPKPRPRNRLTQTPRP